MGVLPQANCSARSRRYKNLKTRLDRCVDSLFLLLQLCLSDETQQKQSNPTNYAFNVMQYTKPYTKYSHSLITVVNLWFFQFSDMWTVPPVTTCLDATWNRQSRSLHTPARAISALGRPRSTSTKCASTMWASRSTQRTCTEWPAPSSPQSRRWDTEYLGPIFICSKNEALCVIVSDNQGWHKPKCNLLKYCSYIQFEY